MKDFLYAKHNSRGYVWSLTHKPPMWLELFLGLTTNLLGYLQYYVLYDVSFYECP